MATYYTGRVIVTSLKEVYEQSGAATGNTKNNNPADSNYIAPYYNNDSCPASTNVECPVAMIDTTVATSNIIEMQLPPITDQYQIIVNGSTNTVNGVTSYYNAGYLRIIINLTTLNNVKPTIAVRMYNGALTVDKTCQISY